VEAERVDRADPGKVQNERFHVIPGEFLDLPVHGLRLLGPEISVRRDVDDLVSLVAADQHRVTYRGLTLRVCCGQTAQQRETTCVPYL